MTIQQDIGQKLMLAFIGRQPSPEILSAILNHRLAGLTLFRSMNVDNAAQVRKLTAALQAAAAEAGLPPLLIATDHEIGQLMAVGEELTPFSSNMALGAIDDPALTEQVGRVMGTELAAIGVNLNYAPVCDVNSNPQNPAVGIRSFGDDPCKAAAHAGALIRGMQSAGVAATAKHFPGLGDAAVDSHYEVPVLNHSRERLETVELPPFKAAVENDVKLIMTGHVGLPALTGNSTLPGTVSRAIMHGLLREEMGFQGVIISDAMEMAAIQQGAGQVIDAIAAVRATVDLLLLNADVNIQQHVFEGLLQAVDRQIISQAELDSSLARIQALKTWLSQFTQPSLDVVGCAAHQALAAEVAARSLTLVKDETKQLPLNLQADEQILVILPELKDLTPADTSSYLQHTLPEAIRDYHGRVDTLLVSHQPTAKEIAAVRSRAAQADRLIVGTISANIYTEQAELVNNLLELDKPIITIALRTPYDLTVYPTAPTHICTYSVHQPAMKAAAAALWGEIDFVGHLPVAVTHS